ncbi:MAG TPA: zeta toxin family protein [Hanamia sp.]|nr:zeta toxin family protein [Hanamia sp.]
MPDVFKTIEFVNADEIARGLSPLNVESVAFQAGRIMLERLEHFIKTKQSFAFETTLSGLAYLNFIRLAKLSGFDITFFFVWLISFHLAKSRVAARVRKGGHHIPDNIIERRYRKGIKNFSKYAQEADSWYLYDNSGAEYLLIAKCIAGEKEIFNFDVFNKISEV